MKFEWRTEHQQAFEQLKKLAVVNMELKLFEVGKPCRLEVDASKIAHGAVFKQKNDSGRWVCVHSIQRSPAVQRDIMM